MMETFSLMDTMRCGDLGSCNFIFDILSWLSCGKRLTEQQFEFTRQALLGMHTATCSYKPVGCSDRQSR